MLAPEPCALDGRGTLKTNTTKRTIVELQSLFSMDIPSIHERAQLANGKILTGWLSQFARITEMSLAVVSPDAKPPAFSHSISGIDHGVGHIGTLRVRSKSSNAPCRCRDDTQNGPLSPLTCSYHRGTAPSRGQEPLREPAVHLPQIAESVSPHVPSPPRWPTVPRSLFPWWGSRSALQGRRATRRPAIPRPGPPATAGKHVLAPCAGRGIEARQETRPHEKPRVDRGVSPAAPGDAGRGPHAWSGHLQAMKKS